MFLPWGSAVIPLEALRTLKPVLMPVLTCMHGIDPLNHSQCTGQWCPFTCRVTGTTTVSRIFPVSRKETVYTSHPDCFVSLFGLILVDPEEKHTGFPGVWPLDQPLIIRPRVRTSAKPPRVRQAWYARVMRQVPLPKQTGSLLAISPKQWVRSLSLLFQKAGAPAELGRHAGVPVPAPGPAGPSCDTRACRRPA